MNNNNTTALSVEQKAQQLWPIPSEMSYLDAEWMSIFRRNFIFGWKARDEEIEELVNILKSWRPFVENAETVNEKDSDYVDSLLCKGNNFINKYNKTT